MRHTSLVLGRAVLLLLFVVTHTSASGVGLRWNACVADGGLLNRSFACDTNTGALFLASSFVLDAGLSGVRRVDVSLELASASSTLPAWWDLVVCRASARGTVSGTFMAPTACVAFPGIDGLAGIVIGEHGPNTERIEIGSTVFPGAPGVNLSAGLEYVPVALRLTLANTIGIGSCAGCEVPVCIVVRSVSLTRVLGTPPDVVLSQPLNGTDANFATWQGGGVPVVGGQAGCPAATPTRRLLWGSVKSLYR
jgi:hypothetical protein